MKHVPLSASSLFATQLFGSLDESLRGSIAGQCVGESYDAGEVIVSCQDCAKDVYFILAGTVHITNFTPEGKEVTFRDQAAGDMFGLLSAIDGQPRSAHVVARDPVTIARLNEDRFDALLSGHPEINRRILCHMASLIRSLSERVTEYGTMSVPQRICAELLRLIPPDRIEGDGVEISPMPTNAEIASRIASHREAVSRELARLAREGLVEKMSHGLRINTISQLRSKLCDAP